jgi:hypothetical protein
MSKRFNNRNLIVILAGLLIILLITIIVKIPKQRSTIREKLVDLDSSKVATIVVTPGRSAGEPFEFVRENGQWSLRQGKIVARPAKNAVTTVFGNILDIKPGNLASVDRSHWKEYDLTDSLATRVKFTDSKGKTLADLMIGRFSFRQARDPYMNGRNNVEGTTYVRLSDDSKIYGVEGFLGLAFSGKFDDWRDRTFIRCNKNDILKITFSFPGDSSYILVKKDHTWSIGEQTADSLKVSDYLNKISYMDGTEFADNYEPPAKPDYTLTFEGNNLLTFNVKCYYDPGTAKYYLNSGLNPDLYFSSKDDGIFRQIVVPRKHFLVK